MQLRHLQNLIAFLLCTAVVPVFNCCTASPDLGNFSGEASYGSVSTDSAVSDVGAVSGVSTSIPPNVSTDETLSSTEYPWNISTDCGEHPMPCVVFGGKWYHPRNDTVEVESLSEDWEYVGTVTVFVGFEQDVVDGDTEYGEIVSNCMPKGAKVYQWKYLLAVEYEDFFVIFKDRSVS